MALPDSDPIRKETRNMAYPGQDKESIKYENERNALEFNAKIEKGDDVKDLPWHGNAWSDMGLFKAVGRFVARTEDREEAKKAILNQSKYGMGIDEPMTEAELDEAIQNDKQWVAELDARKAAD